MPLFAPARILPPGIVVAASLLGCSNLLDYDAISFEDGPPAYTGVNAAYECGTMPVPTVECALCVNASCCGEAQVCGQNQACPALAICRMDCAPEDVGCLHDCGIDHFAGVTDWKALDACVDVQCAVACTAVENR